VSEESEDTAVKQWTPAGGDVLPRQAMDYR
jgi:hypothetical protein